MELTGVTPILNVSDIEASLAWFEQLGWHTGFTWNERFDAPPPATFASVHSGDAEIFLCRDGQGGRGAWVSWWLPSPADVDAAHERAVANGCEIAQPPTDEPWNVREFHLRHPDGHTFRVGAPR